MVDADAVDFEGDGLFEGTGRDIDDGDRAADFRGNPELGTISGEEGEAGALGD